MHVQRNKIEEFLIRSTSICLSIRTRIIQAFKIGLKHLSENNNGAFITFVPCTGEFSIRFSVSIFSGVDAYAFF